MADNLTVREWLEERRQNALTIAASLGVPDPAVWREDADYFRRAVEAIDRRDELRGLWLEWLSFNYDNQDLLRRVKLTVHGPLRKSGNAGVSPTWRCPDCCGVDGCTTCAGTGALPACASAPDHQTDRAAITTPGATS
jgi:hypothetical protein